MSTEHTKAANDRPTSTTCRTCSSRQLQCDGIRPLCDSCKNGNLTCVWPEYGKVPRRGSFTTASQPSNLAISNSSAIQPAHPRILKSAEVSKRDRGLRGGFLNPAGNNSTLQAQKKQSFKPPHTAEAAPHCISYKALLQEDKDTLTAFITACRNEGCFWLDLEGEVELQNGVEWLSHVSKTLHDTSEDEKWKYEVEKADGCNNIRYHYNTATTPLPLAPTQTPKTETETHLSEIWSIDLAPSPSKPSGSSEPYKWPTSIPKNSGTDILSTMTSLHDLTSTLLTAINSSHPTFTSSHSPRKPLGTLHLTRYPASTIFTPTSAAPPHFPHTLTHHRESAGIMNLIFAPVPGLFIQHPESGVAIPVIEHSRTAAEWGMRYAFVYLGGEGVGVSVLREIVCERERSLGLGMRREEGEGEELFEVGFEVEYHLHT